MTRFPSLTVPHCLTGALMASALTCLPGFSQADTGLSADIGKNGIAATIDILAARHDPAPEDLFTLAALRFLGTIEGTLQQQWRHGMDQGLGSLSAVGGMPFLRLPVPPNPAPEPFAGQAVSDLFLSVSTGMDAARADLARLPEAADFAVEIALEDLWFDIDMNGVRDPAEGLGPIAGPILMGWQWQDRAPDAVLPTVRFDAADAAWLSAYTHVLSGISDTVLTYDPATAIDRVLAARVALGLGPRPVGADPTPEQLMEQLASMENSFGAFADALAIVEGAVNQPPDAERARAAKAHFLAMIADNRRFWAAVEAETDNDREWLPNDRQTSALGMTLPQGTGAQWLAVLSDGEAMLEGRLLVPYWRGRDGQGIDIGAMFDDPRPISITGWFQGWAATPYLKDGPMASTGNLMRFEQMMAGDAGLMMVFLN